MHYFKIRDCVRIGVHGFFWAALAAEAALCGWGAPQQTFPALLITGIGYLIYGLFSWRGRLYYLEAAGVPYILSRYDLLSESLKEKSRKAVQDAARWDDAGINILNGIELFFLLEGIQDSLKRFKRKRSLYDGYILRELRVLKNVGKIFVYEATLKSGRKKRMVSWGEIPGKSIKTI